METKKKKKKGILEKIERIRKKEISGWQGGGFRDNISIIM